MLLAVMIVLFEIGIFSRGVIKKKAKLGVHFWFTGEAKCKFCGETLPTGTTFCQNCGKSQK